MTTRHELESLKKDWMSDPIWDIEDTEGFEDHKAELLEFRLEMEDQWRKERLDKRRKEDELAREFGIEGLYNIILNQEKIIERCYRAIAELCSGDDELAYKYLRGYRE